ncbi:MAG: imidazole glycerol phosphate synthase subunit HisH [Candidatus Altiarchaeota archaeon]
MIALIDYYAGNVRSIENAFNKLGTTVTLTKKPSDLEKADAIILPGVGNFGDAMKQLETYRKTLKEEVASGKPFLGLCLGIQIILEKSMEASGVKGLGLIKGECRKFPGKLKVPHMGWNSVKYARENALFKGIPQESYFYFVHSYYPVPEDKDVIAATTEYGVTFPSVIIKDNIMATQFHPEKSGLMGLKLLENFAKLI